MQDIATTDLAGYFELVNADSIRISGHRIGIEHVLQYYLDGYGPDEIATEFPGLSLEKIYATITFYLANKAEIDQYLERIKADDELAYREWQDNPSPVIERLRVLREKQAKYG